MESYSYTTVQSRKESIQTDTFLRQSLKHAVDGPRASAKARLRQNSYKQEDIFHMQTSYTLRLQKHTKRNTPKLGWMQNWALPTFNFTAQMFMLVFF